MESNNLTPEQTRKLWFSGIDIYGPLLTEAGLNKVNQLTPEECQYANPDACETIESFLNSSFEDIETLTDLRNDISSALNIVRRIQSEVNNQMVCLSNIERVIWEKIRNKIIEGGKK